VWGQRILARFSNTPTSNITEQRRDFLMSEQADPSPAILPSQLATPDRRVAVRYSCTMQSLCQTKTARPEDFWWWGKIQDISTSGIGVQIRRRFEPGALLVIEPLTGREAFQPLQVRVIRATKRARGGWLLGCEFVCQPAGRPEDIAPLLPALGWSSASDHFDAK
jgi:hypothetical protein